MIDPSEILSLRYFALTSYKEGLFSHSLKVEVQRRNNQLYWYVGFFCVPYTIFFMWYVKGFTFVYFHFQDKRCQKGQKFKILKIYLTSILIEYSMWNFRVFFLYIPYEILEFLSLYSVWNFLPVFFKQIWHKRYSFQI